MFKYIFQDYSSVSSGLRALFAVNKVGRINIWMRLMFYFYGSKSKIIKWLGGCCHNHILSTYSTEISPGSKIGKGVKFPHPIGIVIGYGSVIGDNVEIYQNVTVGKAKSTYPVIESQVTIFPSCTIIGPVKIGKGTVIGANSLLLCSTEEDSVYAGSPAKRIK